MLMSKFHYQVVSVSTGTMPGFASAGLTRNALTGRTTRASACMCAFVVVGLAGCGNTNPNTGTPPPEGTTRLTPITFGPTSGFPQGTDPAEFSIGDGSITASGGTAQTLGLFGLYADDLFAWDFRAGSEGLITFNDLDVAAIDGYWVHPNTQTDGATMTVMFSGGGSATVASAPVNAGGPISQPIGFFDTVEAPEGESITSLVFAFDEGAPGNYIAALDVLELIVR